MGVQAQPPGVRRSSAPPRLDLIACRSPSSLRVTGGCAWRTLGVHGRHAARTGQGRLPAPLHHRPLQPALHLLHAGGGRRGPRPRRDPQLRGARRLRARRRRRRHHQGAHHRRRAARPPGLRRFRRHARAHQRHRRHLAHHQRRAAAEVRARAGRRAVCTRVNISLDSLDAERFRRITRGGRLEDTLAGIDAAFAAGFSPVKINTLLLPGVEDELDALRRRSPASTTCTCASSSSCLSTGASPATTSSAARGACCPPATCCAGSWQDYVLVGHDGPYGHGPAQYWKVAGARGTIGFIAGVSEHFCATCNRLRLTADGRLRTCLFSGREVEHPPAAQGPCRPAGRHRDGRRRQDLRPLQRGAGQRAVDVPDRRVTVGELSHLDEHGRAAMVDVGGKDETERVARAEAAVVMAPQTLATIARRGRAQGRRDRRGAAGRHHGRQAHPRAHPALPPAEPHQGGGGHRGRRGAAGPAHQHRGAPARTHRRRDGGAGRRVGGGAHRLRHVQGRGPRHGGHRRPPAREERRAQRALAAGGRRRWPAGGPEHPR